MYEGLKPCPHRAVDDGGRILCGLIKSGDREVSVNLCRACPVPQINCQHLRAAMYKKVSTPITVRFATGRVEVWDDDAPSIGFKQAACAVKTMPIHSARDCSGCPLRAPHAIPQNAIQVARRAKSAVLAGAPATSTSPALAETHATPPVSPTAAASTAHADTSPPTATLAMVQRAQALALRNVREGAADATSARPTRAQKPARVENKSKIILLQRWLADQFNKTNAEPKRSAPVPDEDGVQDIVYAPIAPTFQEESGYERCVGWTD